MINIAVCDDNIAFLENFDIILKKCFDRFTDDFQTVKISNGNELLKKHHDTPFDIIFLDIDMPDMNGFDTARAIRESNSRIFIIFITNHAELVYESMDFQPFNFIRKNCGIPVEKMTAQIVEKLIKHMKQNETIVIEDDISGKNVVYIKDIVYIESSKHYIIYHVSTKENPIKMRGNISDCEKNFKKYDFIRIHKCYLVNMRFLSDIDTKRNEIVLASAFSYIFFCQLVLQINQCYYFALGLRQIFIAIWNTMLKLLLLKRLQECLAEKLQQMSLITNSKYKIRKKQKSTYRGQSANSDIVII